MRFAFTEEQDMLRDMIRGALQREAADKVRRWFEAGDPAPFDTIAARNGWTGLGVAEKAGGQGGGLIEQALLFEEIGRCAAPSGGLIATLAGMLGFVAGVDGGLAALGPIVSGAQRGALAAPAGAPADLGLPSVRQKGGRLTGIAPMVVAAQSADRILAPLADADGLDLWLVDGAAEGLRIMPRHLIDRTRQFGDIAFDETPATRLGRLSKAAAVEAGARLALLVAAESLGLARRMLAMTVEYVGQRVQFGVPVGSFQAVKHAAAEALVEIEAAHSGVYYGSWALQEGEADGVLTAWIAKAFATETAVRTADRALLLHGAIGYTWEHDLQIYYKRAKLNLELFGSPKWYRERIAAAIL